MITSFDTSSRTVAVLHKRKKVETDKPFPLNGLNSSHFLEKLRYEKRRADRSKAPLSIALICCENNNRDALRNIKGVLKLIQNSTRETNVLGYLDEDIIGIILPNTDEKGALEFKKRIINQHQHTDLNFSIFTRTYPDQLFNELLAEKKIRYITNLIEINLIIEINLRGCNQEERSLHRERSKKFNLLSESHFLEQLHREKRRADRSKFPLSIMLIQLEKNKRGNLTDLKGFLEFLQNSMRETDILGHICKDVMGIILPDTDEERTQEFKKRIINGREELSFSIVTGTYPDQLFNEILAENQNRLEFFSFFFDNLRKSNRLGYSLKKILDTTGALLGIILFSPVMLITALAIKITSPGPVIFKQIRMGERGVPFVLYKFRSMLWNTDDQMHREYITHLIQGNLQEINQGNKQKPLYKIKSDPRVTRVGKIIRKTSIDELPQFFNVLKGEMSLVGPRPPLTYEVEKYQSWHLRRILEMKPGITGLWQVDGRSVSSFDDMVRFDIRYIVNWSLLLDIKILFRTVKAVVGSSGAI